MTLQVLLMVDPLLQTVATHSFIVPTRPAQYPFFMRYISLNDNLEAVSASFRSKRSGEGRGSRGKQGRQGKEGSKGMKTGLSGG
ncbi:hypothetical protein BDZ91DRAFT_751714 [Kalaharituber pfeilii]|nr:hypothetical protein BDZ91DRAFT_751714 [Kalaharituber pfeilii]